MFDQGRAGSGSSMRGLENGHRGEYDNGGLSGPTLSGPRHFQSDSGMTGASLETYNKASTEVHGSHSQSLNHGQGQNLYKNQDHNQNHNQNRDQNHNNKNPYQNQNQNHYQVPMQMSMSMPMQMHMQMQMPMQMQMHMPMSMQMQMPMPMSVQMQIPPPMSDVNMHPPPQSQLQLQSQSQSQSQSHSHGEKRKLNQIDVGAPLEIALMPSNARNSYNDVSGSIVTTHAEENNHAAKRARVEGNHQQGTVRLDHQIVPQRNGSTQPSSAPAEETPVNVDMNIEGATSSSGPTAPAAPVKRPRGRPPKLKPAVPVVQPTPLPFDSNAPRRRGRPKGSKNKTVEDKTQLEKVNSQSGGKEAKREKRGRPKGSKNKNQRPKVVKAPAVRSRRSKKTIEVNNSTPIDPAISTSTTTTSVSNVPTIPSIPAIPNIPIISTISTTPTAPTIPTVPTTNTTPVDAAAAPSTTKVPRKPRAPRASKTSQAPTGVPARRGRPKGRLNNSTVARLAAEAAAGIVTKKKRKFKSRAAKKYIINPDGSVTKPHRGRPRKDGTSNNGKAEPKEKSSRREINRLGDQNVAPDTSSASLLLQAAATSQLLNGRALLLSA